VEEKEEERAIERANQDGQVKVERYELIKRTLPDDDDVCVCLCARARVCRDDEQTRSPQAQSPHAAALGGEERAHRGSARDARSHTGAGSLRAAAYRCLNQSPGRAREAGVVARMRFCLPSISTVTLKPSTLNHISQSLKPETRSCGDNVDCADLAPPIKRVQGSGFRV